MKINPLLKRRCSAALASAAIAFASGPAYAASLTWNTTDGAWDLDAANWSTGGSPAAWSQTGTTAPLNDAYFGGAGGTITIGGTQMAATKLTFATTGYTLTGGTVYLAGVSSGTSSVATGVTATIDSGIATPGNTQVRLKSDGVLSLGGGFGASSPQLYLEGSGTMNITGGNTTNLSVTTLNAGTMNQSGGLFTINTGAGAWINYSASRNVAYTVTGGTLALNNGGAGTYLGVGRGTGDFGASLVVKDGGAVNVGTTNYGILSVAVDGNSNGLIDVQGGALTVGSNKATNKIVLFNAGSGAGKTATYKQSGGTATVNGFQFGGSAIQAYNATSSAKLLLTGGDLYVGSLGITQASGSSANLPVTIELGGGTLGASAAWSSSLNMNLTGSNGNVTLRAADAGGTARDVTLSGNLSGAGGFAKTGSGVLTLSGSNSYAGTTAIDAGTLHVGNANGLGASSALSFGGGTLRYGVSGTYAGGIVNSGSAIAIDTNGNSATLTGNIDSTNTGGLTKSGAGVLALGGNVNYSGTTTVGSGTLAFGSSSVANLSGIWKVTGTSTVQIENGAQVNVNGVSGIVQFVPNGGGSNQSGRLAGSGTLSMTTSFLRPAGVNNSNYSFTIDNATVSAASATLEGGRGGGSNTLNITNGAQVSVAAVTVGVDGNNFAMNVSGGSTLALNNGSLLMRGGWGSNNSLNIDSATVTGVNAVGFNNSPDAAINITNGGLLSSQASTISATNALVSVSGTGSHWTLNGKGLGIGVAGNTFTSTVRVSAGGKITAGSVSVASGENYFVFDGGILAAGTNGTLLASAGTVSVKNGGAIIDSGAFGVTVSAALGEDASSVGGGLTKLGSGTMTLSSADNTFTGNTTISEGRLVLADNAQLLFKIGASGVNNSINGVGAVTLNGDFNFDLSTAGTTGSWNIVDVANLEETFGTSFSVVGFGNVGNLWSKQVGDYTYSFNEETGVLLVVPEPNTWAMFVGGFGMLVSFQRLRRRRVGTL